MGCRRDNPPYYMSAYSLAQRRGYQGSLDEWLESLTAYGIARLLGFAGSKEEWLESLKVEGVPGKSAYQYAQDGGYDGTVDEFIAKLAMEWALVGHNHQAEALAPKGLELHPGPSAGHGGYIDFHYNDADQDYTTRIVEAPEGILKLNGFEIVTTEKSCDWYNLPLTFANGVATFENSGIQYMDVLMVQRRGNVAGANLSFCTQTYDGYAIICTDSSMSDTIYVNIQLTRL